MALIKCPGCGNMISEKAIKCPKCGMPVTKYEVKPQHNHIANEAPVFSERGGSSNMWLYGIIALLLVAIAGCGYWWYSQNNSVEHLLASSETDSHQNEGSEGGAINDSGEISAKQVFQANGVSFTMIGVQGGTFRMGCSKREDSNADSNESPTHPVTLDSYYIGETEVTQELWEAVMDYNPSEFQYDNQLPVEFVSWDDCKEFIRRLNNITQKEFRFPELTDEELAALQVDPEMKDYDECCGFAGEFALKNHKLSVDISKKKAMNIIKTGADIVVTTCPSCVMGLKQGLFGLKNTPKVLSLSEFLLNLKVIE